MEVPADTTPATLCYPVVGQEVLLIRKQRGLGAGKIVGPGGTIEPGESPRECVIREVQEEVGVDVDPTKVGELDFWIGGEPETFAHVYKAKGIEGTPSKSPEAVPEWHSVTALPYHEMWPADRCWVPHVLNDEYFEAQVRMDGSGERVKLYERLE